MLRKVLTLGMVFILALSLLAVSMITCFTYEAEAHDIEECHIIWLCICNICIPIGEICEPVWHTHG